MKKNYILAGMALLSAVSFGQDAQPVNAEKSVSQPVVTRVDASFDRAPGDIIGDVLDFTDESAWIIDNDDAAPGGWVIGTDVPAGPFSGGMGAIMSTSGGNYALFDADGTTGTGYVQMADPVDLTGVDNVAFQFESYYRNFTGTASFEISIDGATWESYEVHGLLPLNESTGNPEVVSVNISELAGGESTVWARFVYVSGDDYAWMVDDAAFVEGFDDQLILNESYLSMGAEGLDYYMIPTSQIQEATFGAFISNNGTNDQTNTTLNVTITDGYDESSTAATVPAFSTDSLSIVTPGWTPAGDGTYTVSYSIGSADFTDQAPDDNDVTLEPITVGGNVYARDNNVPTGSVGFLGGSPPVTVMGNFYEFSSLFNLGKVDVMIDASSLAGEIIYAEIRVFDGAEFTVVSVSDDYILEAGDPGSFVTLSLPDIIECEAGSVYMIGVGHYGSEDVRVTTGQVAVGAVIYSDGAANQQNSVFMVRAVEVFSSLPESQVVTGLSLYPNPSVDNTTLEYTLLEESVVSLTITDLSGKVVLAENLGSQAAGTQITTISTEGMAEGIYFYTLNVNGVETTNKLVVAAK